MFCLQGQFKFDAEIDTPLSEQDRKVRIAFVVEKIVCLLSGLFGKIPPFRTVIQKNIKEHVSLVLSTSSWPFFVYTCTNVH